MPSFDSYDIQKYRQDRYPAFFVDGITDLSPGKYAKGIKNFSFNEWFLQNNHNLSVPSVIVGEALKQTYLMTFLTLPGNKGLKTSAVSLEAEYFKEVKYGDRLEIEAELLFNSKEMTKGKSVGKVNGQAVCKADFTVIILDIMNKFKPKTGEE